MLHGSETFFVEGEGVLTTQVGGRDGAAADPVNESETPRVAAARALAAGAAPPFRFSRVGPKGTPLNATILKKLARAMTVGGGGLGDVPAGYTYLGQFIDHDLTMDRTKVMLGTEVSPTDLLQGRSPRLDLDSLYGAGPGSARSAKFYAADGLHLKVGSTIDDGFGAKAGHDLPRAGTGPTEKAKRTAVIPDPRNDENLIVAQTHVAMIRFHNRVVDKTSTTLTPSQRFTQARKQVTLHYQWLIRHDYLPRIVQPAVLDRVWSQGRKLVEPDAPPTAVPTMPIEFSVAAFRLGHSMVRQAYNWNAVFPDEAGELSYMFQFSALGGNLGGSRRLISSWLADWRRMYDFPNATKPRTGLTGPGGVNHARRIDTRLTVPLSVLPPSTFGGAASIPETDLRRNLAFRNLTRGAMVSLASGQQMVTRLASRGVNVTPLTRAQILEGRNGAKLDGLTSAEKDRLATRTPLWFYVLREAEHNRGRLKGVGARIVAETFHRTMEGSRFSIVRDPSFTPTFGPDASTFEMTDLLFFAFQGKRSGLAPVG
ncbi:MAG: heme peroxidase [Nocardioidaceae bacterium]|nr:heme peroxidase [Nocardioidaceae bacterium]NUS49455.1 heme peroxidase [Nocardioidaceae bacterium]